mgnify:FL=1
MDDPFPTTPFDVLDPIPPRTIEYFSQYVRSYPHYVHSTATNRIVTRSSRLFPGYVVCAPSFVWNKLFFLHQNYRGQEQYYRLTDIEFAELNRRRIANLHYHQMQYLRTKWLVNDPSSNET